MKRKPIKEYLYAIANEVTGMDLVRSVWAKDIDDALNKVEKIAKCFGPATEVIGVEEANAPQLKLQGGSNAKKDVVARSAHRQPRRIPDKVSSR